MKTKILLATLFLSSLAFLSCKKVAPENPDLKSEPAILTINLAGSADTKASGAPVEATETKINKGVVFVFKGTGSDPVLDGKATFDFTSSNVTPVRVNITSGTRQVYVLANVNPDDFANVNNLSNLYNATNKLTLTNFRSAGSLPMSGFVPNVDATSASTTTPATTTVNLSFVGSRIHVDWDITNLNSGLQGLVINGAAIINAKTKTDYFAVPLTASTFKSLTDNVTDFGQGLGASINFVGTYLPSSGHTNSYDAGLAIASADKGFAANFNYVFENDTPHPTIVTIIGTYNSKTFYWPIVINGALNGIGGADQGDMSASIHRGKIYNVKAVIKGNGNEDPYAPINPAAIDVTIVPASWDPVINISQEFN